jgi:hypothetical protein
MLPIEYRFIQTRKKEKAVENCTAVIFTVYSLQFNKYNYMDYIKEKQGMHTLLPLVQSSGIFTVD